MIINSHAEHFFVTPPGHQPCFKLGSEKLLYPPELTLVEANPVGLLRLVWSHIGFNRGQFMAKVNDQDTQTLVAYRAMPGTGIEDAVQPLPNGRFSIVVSFATLPVQETVAFEPRPFSAS